MKYKNLCNKCVYYHYLLILITPLCKKNAIYKKSVINGKTYIINPEHLNLCKDKNFNFSCKDFKKANFITLFFRWLIW